MSRLSLLRIIYGVALLAEPALGGVRRRESVTNATRNALRLIAVRHLLEAAICGVRPCKCVLWMEALVETIHTITMVIAAGAAERPSTRRAVTVSGLTAAVFVGADVITAERTAPGGAKENNRLLKRRNAFADRLCGVLPPAVIFR